jgi:two-component system response regulator MprA
MRILVVDDDVEVRESLQRSLEFEGYSVDTAQDGAQALDGIDGNLPQRPDLLIVDLMMPVVDGMELCRRLRAAGNRVPVLMLTALDSLGDRVTGLDSGADDYLAKPFALEELLARLRALDKRSHGHRTTAEHHVLRFADVELDPDSREVSRAGWPIVLTPTEFELLELLICAPRRVLTRTFLQQEIWGHQPATNNLDVYVGYLRRKLEADGGERLVHTVRGVGYVLRES